MATFQKGKDLGLPWAIGAIGFALGMSGQTDEAKKLLHELIEMSKKKYVLPAFMVWIYASLGDADGAFEWLEKCYEERDTWMFWFKYIPEFDKIRSDPRFDDMLKRLNLK